MGYIYKITNSINNKIYIGQTVNSLEQRFIEHKSHWKKNYSKSNRPLYNAFSKYGVENFKIEQVEEVDNSLLNEREKYWIRFFNSYENGYNATLGGDSTILYDYNEILNLYKEKRNLSEVARILNCNYTTISKALKSLGVHIEQQPKILKNSKAICMLDKNNNVLKNFDRLMDASIYIRDNNYSQNKNLSSISGKISEVCKGKRKTAYGYKWTYTE